MFYVKRETGAVVLHVTSSCDAVYHHTLERNDDAPGAHLDMGWDQKGWIITGECIKRCDNYALSCSL